MDQTHQKPSDDYLAEKYSRLNDYQMKTGKDFISSLNVKHGDRLSVLDMGCGTGELTAFIAETLGDNSEITGVDPILARISIARNKHSRKNLTFIHGDSSSEFLRYNESCYDLHFSNFVVQWLNLKEKEMFLNTAFRILKPGGRLAVQCVEEQSDILSAALDVLLNDRIERKQPVPEHFVKKSELEDLSRQAGFSIVSNAYKPASFRFKDVDHFLNWISATYYMSESKQCADKIKNFVQTFGNQDGTVTCAEPTIYQFVAMKP